MGKPNSPWLCLANKVVKVLGLCYNSNMNKEPLGDKQDTKHSQLDNFGDKRHPPWEPGQSGNPNGRPLKENCITSLVKELLEKDAGSGKTYAQLVAEAIVKLATTPDARGHVPTVKELLDRVEGKVLDRHKIEGDIPVTLIREPVTKEDERWSDE